MAFFTRFRWIFIILGIAIATCIVLLVVKQNDQSGQKVQNSFSESRKNSFNERIVKTFLPDSKTAFKYASPMLYNKHIYIGTSEKTGYDYAPISQMNDNFFYKFDLDLNVKWKIPAQQKNGYWWRGNG